MRLVPTRYIGVIVCITFKPKNAVRTIGYDDGRRIPFIVEVNRISEKCLHMPVTPGTCLRRSRELNGLGTPDSTRRLSNGIPCLNCRIHLLLLLKRG